MSILTAGREAPTAYNALGEYVELTAGREAPTAQNTLGVHQTAGRKAPTAANAIRRIHVGGPRAAKLQRPVVAPLLCIALTVLRKKHRP